MTQEEKELLLKDLCARLPYDVKIQGTVYEDILDNYGDETGTVNEEIVIFILHIIGKDSIMYNGCWIPLESCKPYLRPMSSMTEEEKRELGIISCGYNPQHAYGLFYESQDFLNYHHFDYRGLIEKGLALEAPTDMYNTKQ